jgi:hypothetical protein
MEPLFNLFLFSAFSAITFLAHKITSSLCKMYFAGIESDRNEADQKPFSLFLSNSAYKCDPGFGKTLSFFVQVGALVDASGFPLAAGGLAHGIQLPLPDTFT